LDPMSRRDRIKATKRAGGDEEKPMLFVGNLPWVLDSWGLEKLFEPYGKVRRHLSNAQMCVQLWVFTARAWGCKGTPRSMCVAPASHGPSNIGLHVP
jgi:RNA recognition motif-containing protein